MGFGYEFFVRRPGGAIDRQEWDRFVAETPDLEASGANKVIWRRALDPGAEAHLRWLDHGEIVVRLAIVDGEEVDELVALVAPLGAQVTGESGESYPPEECW